MMKPSCGEAVGELWGNRCSFCGEQRHPATRGFHRLSGQRLSQRLVASTRTALSLSRWLVLGEAPIPRHIFLVA